MRAAGLALLVCAVLALAARAEDKPASNTDSIIGMWQVVDAGQHEVVIKGMVEQLHVLADAFESVKDKDTAKTAAGKINKVCERLSELAKQVKKLPKLTQEEDKRFQKKYEPELAKASRRLQQVAVQAGTNSGGEPEFLKSLGRLQEVGKALQSLGGK
jgi:hypothetical protein